MSELLVLRPTELGWKNQPDDKFSRRVQAYMPSSQVLRHRTITLFDALAAGAQEIRVLKNNTFEPAGPVALQAPCLVMVSHSAVVLLRWIWAATLAATPEAARAGGIFIAAAVLAAALQTFGSKNNSKYTANDINACEADKYPSTVATAGVVGCCVIGCRVVRCHDGNA
jgi:hypothetical protein